MKRKIDLFDELSIKKPEKDIYTALDTDIQSVRHAVDKKLAFAFTERELKIMKSRKKLFVIAVATVVVLGVAAFAASGNVASRFSSSSAFSNYKSLPTQERVVKDIGYEAVLIDSFKNGYAFDSGRVVKNTLADEDGNAVEKFKSVNFDYKKAGDTVYFSQNKFNSETEKEGNVIFSVNGTELYYYSYINKLVPPDYELTEEDKKAEENGELVFSYGASEVDISKVQSITWEKDGIKYCLMQMDGKLSAQELAGMAKEILEK